MKGKRDLMEQCSIPNSVQYLGPKGRFLQDLLSLGVLLRAVAIPAPSDSKGHCSSTRAPSTDGSPGENGNWAGKEEVTGLGGDFR